MNLMVVFQFKYGIEGVQIWWMVSLSLKLTWGFLYYIMGNIFEVLSCEIEKLKMLSNVVHMGSCLDDL